MMATVDLQRVHAAYPCLPDHPAAWESRFVVGDVSELDELPVGGRARKVLPTPVAR